MVADPGGENAPGPKRAELHHLDVEQVGQDVAAEAGDDHDVGFEAAHLRLLHVVDDAFGVLGPQLGPLPQQARVEDAEPALTALPHVQLGHPLGEGAVDVRQENLCQLGKRVVIEIVPIIYKPFFNTDI